MRRVLAIALAGSAFLGACGGSSGGDEDLVSALKADLLANMGEASADSPLQVDDAQASCVAEKMVSDIGADALEAAGASGSDASDFKIENLDEGDRGEVADAFLGCVSLGELMTDTLLADADVELSGDSAKCFGDKIGDDPAFKDAIRGAIVSGDNADIESAMGDNAAFLQTMLTAMTDCFSAEEMQSITG